MLQVAGLLSTGVSNVDNRGVKVSKEDVAAFSQFKVSCLLALAARLTNALRQVSRSLSEDARNFLSQVRYCFLDESSFSRARSLRNTWRTD